MLHLQLPAHSCLRLPRSARPSGSEAAAASTTGELSTPARKSFTTSRTMSPSQLNESVFGSDESFMLHHGFSSLGSLVIFSFTFLLGLPGNCIVIWVLSLKMKRTANTLWFLHLAVADCVCCLSLPFSIVDLVLHKQWPYGWLLCKIIPTAIIFNMFASVFLLTAISIDRCLLVTKPVWCQNHRTARFVSVLCVGIWLLAFLMCCPAFIYRETSIDENGNIQCVYNWHEEEYAADEWFDGLLHGHNESSFQHSALTSGRTHDDIFTDGTLGVHLKHQKVPYSSFPNSPGINPDAASTASTKPTAILLKAPRSQPNATISNDLHSDISIYSDTFQSGSNYENFFDSNDSVEIQPPNVLVSITLTRSVFGFFLPFAIMATCYGLIAHRMLNSQFAKSRRKALRVILLVVVIFFICWAPYHLIGVLYLLTPPGSIFYERLTSWDHVSRALAYVNSCINPIIYVCMGHNFRKEACPKIQGIFERIFSEEGTKSTACSQDRSKSAGCKDIELSVL